MRRALASLVLPLLATFGLAQAAYAHPGHATGFTGGLAHPLTGIDHILAMVAVGVWAMQKGGRARFLIPASFLAFMTLGGLVSFAGLHLPAQLTESGIATSILVLGLLIATASKLPTLAGMLLVGAFALCHGYAHAAEMPADASALTFSLGFLLSTATLHIAGLLLGLTAARLAKTSLLRATGGLIAAASLLFFFNIL